MKRFILKVLPGILVICIIGIFGFQLVKALIDNPQINYYGDWPGHLDKANKLNWPWKSGWDTTFWDGYPTFVYPPLSHVLLKLGLAVFHSPIQSIQGALIFAFSLQLIALLKLASTLPPQKKYLQAIYFAVSVMILVAEPSQILGSFRGTILVGGLAANLGSSCLLLILATTNPYTQALIFGLTLLTHTLSAFLAGLILVGQLIIQLLTHVHNKIPLKSQLFIPLFWGLIIGFPWIITQIDPAFGGVGLNLGGEDLFLNSSLLFVSLFLFLEYYQPNRTFLAVIISGLLSIVPHWLAIFIERLGLHGLHFYRFVLYFHLSLTLWFAQLLAHAKKTDLTTKASLFILTIVLVRLILTSPANQNTYHFTQLAPFPDNSNSRSMDISGTNYSGYFNRLAEHLLAQNPNQIGSVGLFFESSQHGGLFYSVAKALNPFFFDSGSYQHYFNDFSQLPIETNLSHNAAILGISRILYFAPGIDQGFAAPTATIGAAISSDPQQAPLYLYSAKINNSQLIESLPQLPELDPTVNLADWWYQTDKTTRFVRQPLNPPPQLNYNQPTVTNVWITPTIIDFTVESTHPTPILIKFAFNKYWRNTTDPQHQPAWITPGHMLVFAAGKTRLEWQPPIYLSLAYLPSLAAIGYLLLKKFSR